MAETKETKTARKDVPVALGVICIILVASLAMTIVAYTQITSRLDSQLASLQKQVNDLQNTTDFNRFFLGFWNISLVTLDVNFSPPISMHNALRIALEGSGWNASSLSSWIVFVSLQYMTYTSAFNWYAHDVTQPSKDYSPVQVNGTTYRYVWNIRVDQIPHVRFPPPGYYFVEAATGEVIPVELI